MVIGRIKIYASLQYKHLCILMAFMDLFAKKAYIYSYIFMYIITMPSFVTPVAEDLKKIT